MPKPDPADVPYAQESRKGYIYVLLHPAMRLPSGVQIAKIGATRKHPIQRATELAAPTGVPGMFSVAYWASCDDCFAVEQLCHEHFAEYRVDVAREYFSVPVGEVVAFVREAITPGREGGEWIEQDCDAQLGTDYPWARLFASFDPNGPPELSQAEQAQCRALEERMR